MSIVCSDCMICAKRSEACGVNGHTYLHVLSVYEVCTMITRLWGLYTIWKMIHKYHMHVQALEMSYISTAIVKRLYTQHTMCNSLKNICTLCVQTV